MVSIPFHDFYYYALSFIFSRSWQPPIENGARSELSGDERAEREKQRADRLAAKLQELGIDVASL
jgi:hypothetical protein